MKGFAYKFSSCARQEKPRNGITDLLEKAQDGEKLLRQEKDRIAEILYGLFSGHSSIYRLGGWAWPMNQLREFLVSFRYDPETYTSYRAADKTSLRKALPGVYRIIEVK